MPFPVTIRQLAARLGISGGRGDHAANDIFGPDAIFAYSAHVPIRIPLDLCRGYIHPGFGAGAGNPLRDTAAIYAETGSIEKARAFLRSFYESFQPKTLAEALFRTNDPTLAPLTDMSSYTQFQPWRLSTRISPKHLAVGSQNFGPVAPEKLDVEVRKLTSYVDSISRRGYRPDLYAKRAIQGYFLLHGDEYRFLVTNGMHRTSVLAALGETTLAADFDPRRPRYIDSARATMWPQVRSGFCPEPVAMRFVTRLMP
jgi:hypothetical protein